MGTNNMRYKDMLGFPKKKSKKKVIPEQPKSSVTEKLKEELNEWNDTTFKNLPKRWSGGSGLTEFERKGGKDNVNEGPAYEYAKSTKNIEKSWKNTHKAVMGLVKELQKKGLKEEAFKIEKLIERVWSEFDHFFEETMDKLQ